MPPELIPVHRLSFSGLLLLLVSVCSEPSTSSASFSTPFNTPDNVEMTISSLSTASQGTTYLEMTYKSRLPMSTTLPATLDIGITSNVTMTAESTESSYEQADKETDVTAVMVSTPILAKFTNSEWSQAMRTEEKTATYSTTEPTTGSLQDNMTTVSTTESIPTSRLMPLATNPPPKRSKFTDAIRTAIKQFMSTAGSELTRKLLQADISTDCTLGLLQFTRAIQELEPWAMRLIDATAKYPTGLLQATVSDLGAYDECIETVVRYEDGVKKVRGQYCDVHLSLGDDNLLVEDLVPALLYSHSRLRATMSEKPSIQLYQLQQPPPLDFDRMSEWPVWIEHFDDYLFATGPNERSGEAQVRTLLYTMRWPGESVEQFVTAQHVLADRCDFNSLKERMIRDRLVVGLPDAKLSAALQMDSQLTLATALAKACLKESVQQQQCTLQGDDGQSSELRDHGSNVDAVAQQNRRQHGQARPQVQPPPARRKPEERCRFCSGGAHPRTASRLELPSFTTVAAKDTLLKPV
ncbi:uncharacterized protein LOC125942659 [Dermacentor silvarum]|uniref:uncharacterized protein LOC125942659 n=1 Tax=Dermacentor silvarum TaxID=543639 RepID=UPI002100954D|nr:uncharacterized protein LOC125942659 [Dermacentor silvarum]